MSEAPPTPGPDDKDWTWVLERPCPECGFDASTVSDLRARIRAAAAGLLAALDRPGARDRAAPEVWSPLEYACHARDVCIVFGARLSSMRGTDDPQFVNWDQDETALTERYWEQDPAVVAEQLATESGRIAADFAGVRPEEWARPGRRSNGSVFTVETLSRYFLHDLEHHAHDVSLA